MSVVSDVIKEMGLDVSPKILDGLKLSGFEDANTRRLTVAAHLMRKSRVASLKPLLPLLLNLKGEPYSLDNYFPFEPFFRTRMARKSLLKTGRQVSKSTSLASRGVVQSNCLPYFSTLYVTPLFEMIRRFSQNYIRPFIEQSPVVNVFTGTNTIGSVLQRTFRNNSQMIFSFAFLDAERTRGISADQNCFVGDTIIETRNRGGIRIDEARTGDIVPAVNNDGKVVDDVVTEKIFQGVQQIYEVRFSNGSVLRCTKDSRFKTAEGEWIRLSTLFSPGEKTEEGASVDLRARTTSTRLFARGCLPVKIEQHSKPAGMLPPRRVSRSVLPTQGSSLRRVRVHTTKSERKQRLGQSILRVQHRKRRGAGSAVCADLSGRKETRQSGLARTTRLARNRLLAHGRRGTTKKYYPLQHARVHRKGSGPHRVRPTATRIVVGQTSPVHKLSYRKALSLSLPAGRGLQETVRKRIRVRPEDDVLQARETSPRNCLFDVRENDRSEAASDCGIESRLRARVSKSETSFVHVVHVKRLDLKPVWDINTQREHCFFAEGVLTHNCYDEVQDLDKDFIPIIRETMSGSKYGGIESFAGTPKTLENTIETLWRDSSMAEWVIKCHRCNYHNVPAMTHDLDKMIGPLRDDISFNNPAVICAKCRRPIHPKLHGRWVHAHPEKRWTFAGYHVPQIIMPMHYGNAEKWDVLLGKREGRGNTPIHVFYNEVCGESYDTGSKLVTLTDLMKAACLPWKNEVEEAQKQIGEYTLRCLGVDWGGGGEQGISFTTYSVLGMMPDGRVDCLYALRSLTPHDHAREARLAIALLTRFKCHLMAHDYTGAGSLRETFINQAGFPYNRIIACQLQRAAVGGIIVPKPRTDRHPRDYYLVDKPRSLQLTCQQIKTGWLRFFQDDYKDAENPGLIREFLALVEEKVDSRLGKDIYTIIRDPALSDDFAQATNLGLITLYQATGNWPNLAEIENIGIDRAIMDALNPENPNWDLD